MTAPRREKEGMTLTRDFNQTVKERVEREPAFAKALLDEAATLFQGGETDAARLILRDLVNETVGFEALAEMTNNLGMQSSKTTILGMSPSRFATRAKQAGERAVAANLQAGIPVTGMINGRLQTIAPDDFRAVNLIAKARST